MAKQTFTTGQVLTAAQMTSLQQTAMLGGAASAKTASYTLVAADAGTAISMNNASATTITVNTALFADGDIVNITNLGAGVCTITAGTATVNTAASLALAQYESGTLDFISTSSAVFVKGAGAATGAAKTYTLVNAGGTALSGTSVSITGLSSYDDLFIVVRGASCTTSGQTLYMSVNSVTSANSYTRAGSLLDFKATYANTIAKEENASDTEIRLATFGNNAGSSASGGVSISGCRGSGVKPVDVVFGTVAGGSTTDNGAIFTKGVINATTAISSVQIFSGTFDAGTIYVYGAV
jgi:hypothetical protein